MDPKTANDTARRLVKYYPKDQLSHEVFDLLVAEAMFGWNEVFMSLGSGLRCLEIGAGTGMLATLASEHVQSVDAIEPAPRAFSFSEPVLANVKNSAPENLHFFRATLEAYTDPVGYDFIWSVNVFEHLEDWREGLLKTKSLLRKDGQAIILCPNYDIPYETHYGIPMIGSKKITSRLFAQKISTFDKKHKCVGLWDTINLISASKIKKFAKQENLNIVFDKSITLRMFDRFFEDQHLAQRHGTLRRVITLIYKLGLHKLWHRLPSRFQPYMALHLYADDRDQTNEDV